MKTIYKIGFSTLIVLLLAILAYAYGGTNPAVHGHDNGELTIGNPNIEVRVNNFACTAGQRCIGTVYCLEGQQAIGGSCRMWHVGASSGRWQGYLDPDTNYYGCDINTAVNTADLYVEVYCMSYD